MSQLYIKFGNLLQILNLSIWSVMLTGMTALFLVGQALNIKNEYESLSVFQIVKRPCWAIILSWIVYSCYYGYGGRSLLLKQFNLK